MHNYLLFFAALAVLVLAANSPAQSRPDKRRLGEAPFAAGSSPANDPTGTRPISDQERALAKQSYQMGLKYARAGLNEQAVQSFEKAVKFDPTYAEAHYSLGNAYLELKQWREAVKSFEHAVRFNARNEEAQTKLAEARLKLRIASNPPRQSENTTRKIKASLNDASSVPADASKPAGDVKTSPDKVSTSQSDESKFLSNESNSVAPNSPAPKPEDDPTRVYRIGVGDILDVRLGDAVPAQATLFTVTASGLLEHPNLPEPVPVSGFTTEEIKIRLENDLKRRAISEEPKVAVTVSEYQSHAILVSGMVKEPGTKLIRREAIPLYVVIADAQPLAEAGRLTLIQHETRKVFNIDLSEPAQMNVLVRPGDVITVHRNRSQFFYLGGEVKSPGEKPFRPGLTLTQAILVAEGLTKKGKEAQLAREKADGFLHVTRYKLKDINSGKVEDPLIQPGDRITIVD